MKTIVNGIVYESTPEKACGSCMGCDLETSSGGCLAAYESEPLNCLEKGVIWIKSAEAVDVGATITTDYKISFSTGKVVLLNEKEFSELKKLFGV